MEYRKQKGEDYEVQERRRSNEKKIVEWDQVTKQAQEDAGLEQIWQQSESTSLEDAARVERVPWRLTIFGQAKKNTMCNYEQNGNPSEGNAEVEKKRNQLKIGIEYLENWNTSQNLWTCKRRDKPISDGLQEDTRKKAAGNQNQTCALISCRTSRQDAQNVAKHGKTRTANMQTRGRNWKSWKSQTSRKIRSYHKEKKVEEEGVAMYEGGFQASKAVALKE